MPELDAPNGRIAGATKRLRALVDHAHYGAFSRMDVAVDDVAALLDAPAPQPPTPSEDRRDTEQRDPVACVKVTRSLGHIYVGWEWVSDRTALEQLPDGRHYLYADEVDAAIDASRTTSTTTGGGDD